MPERRPLTPPDLWWTPWPGVGPGAELLGDLTGRTVLELGCGRGDNAAACATLGAGATGIDIRPDRIEHALSRWGHMPGLRFVHADAATYLATNTVPMDLVLSIFGAFSFSGPNLVALVAQRLAPGGKVALSARLELGPTGQGRTAAEWANLVTYFGFAIDHWMILDDPAGRSPACLISVATQNES